MPFCNQRNAANVKFGEACFCTYIRPRYQLRIYRTIDPLVYLYPCMSKNELFVSFMTFEAVLLS